MIYLSLQGFFKSQAVPVELIFAVLLCAHCRFSVGDEKKTTHIHNDRCIKEKLDTSKVQTTLINPTLYFKLVINIPPLTLPEDVIKPCTYNKSWINLTLYGNHYTEVHMANFIWNSWTTFTLSPYNPLLQHIRC